MKRRTFVRPEAQTDIKEAALLLDRAAHDLILLQRRRECLGNYAIRE
jgi:hypothetical protein